MNVPFLDLSRHHEPLKEAIASSLREVLDSGQFILGPETEKLESEMAALCGAAHAIAVGSGSDALLLALLALGVGPGDEVITTPFTFIATATAVTRAGARPVFADIDPQDFTLDPAAAEAAVRPSTRAIMPVDLYGRCAAWGSFEAIGARLGVSLVEDAAQSIGAERDGRRAGAFGDAAGFSFYPTKNLGGMGDGGMVTTMSSEAARRVRLLRNHGDAGGYRHLEAGMNSRLDAFQAAVLRVKLRSLRAWNAERSRLAERYGGLLRQALPGLEGGDGPLRLPAAEHSVFHLYVVRARERDALAEHLRGRGIGCGVYYPVPLHLQACFSHLGYKKGAFPEAERAAEEVLALPLFPGLREAEQEEVCSAVAAFYGAGR